MKIRELIAGAAACAVLLGVADIALSAPALQKPLWAYAVQMGPADPLPPYDAKLYHLPGSSMAFTFAKIKAVDKTNPGVADWYPADHPPMPKVVAIGDEGPGSRGVRPCAICHYPNGKGRSENASVAGQPHDYIVATLHDMKTGVRKSSEPLKINAGQMDDYARGMTDQEIEQAATYFSSMAWTPWIKVVETTTVPKTHANGGLYLVEEGPKAGKEPLGHRIIETPTDGYKTDVEKDPHTSFIAYVPIGSVAKGKALVTTGGNGKTTACSTCHGANLSGVGNIPSIAARSPSYMARQLNDFQQGTRHGAMASLMKQPVSKLTEDDILDITAYLASLPPGKPAA